MSTLPPALGKPAVAASIDEHDALPAGTRFGEFEILRVLGVGGFGIVYLAYDHSLERAVALKEYMPASLAARGSGPQITVRSSSFAETYAIGLRSFINEARLLARFDHPSLVKVYRFWEDNATAYMVMPFLQGTTLRDARRRMAQPPGEAWIRSVIAPILSALELLHREGVYHRDVAPDNVLLPLDGPPVLLDFGAARRVIGDRTQSLTAILKPSYAPIEQYAEMTQLRQGPWTDLYGLGALVHFLVFGRAPSPATARAVADDGDAAALHRTVDGFSPRFIDTMWWMLAVRPNARPQSGAQLRAVLDGNAEVPARAPPEMTIASAAHAPVPHAPAVQAPSSQPPAVQPLTLPPAALASRAGAGADASTRSAPARRIRVAGGAILAVLAVLVLAAALQLAGRRDSALAHAAGPASASVTATIPITPVPATVSAEQSTAPSELIIESAGTAAADAGTRPVSAAAKKAVQAKTAPSPAPARERERDFRSLALDQAPILESPARVRARRPLPAAVAPKTVREACASKQSFIARAVCIDERCEEPQFRALGDCPAILERKRQREH